MEDSIQKINMISVTGQIRRKNEYACVSCGLLEAFRNIWKLDEVISRLGPVYTRPESTNPQKYFSVLASCLHGNDENDGIVFGDSGKI